MLNFASKGNARMKPKQHNHIVEVVIHIYTKGLLRFVNKWKQRTALLLQQCPKIWVNYWKQIGCTPETHLAESSMATDN